MSKAVEKASTLKPEIRLAQAISEFEACLSTEQKAALQQDRLGRTSPTTADIMRFTAKLDREFSGHRCFGPRLTNFLHGVQQFAALGDIVIGGSQSIIACSIWALTRLTLMTVVKFSTYYEKISELLMYVGRSAPRYEALATLYSRSKNLQSYLLEYFTVVVQMCHTIFTFPQKSTIKKLGVILDDSQLSIYQSELESLGSAIKDEVFLQMSIDISEEKKQNSSFRSLSAKLSETAAHRQRLKRNLKVLEYCSTFDHETTWKQIRKSGKASFFNELPNYRQWREHTWSSVLFVEGKLGSGKSVTLANVVDDLHLYSQNSGDATVAYFFCRADIEESMRARTVLGSLTRQLLSKIDDLSKVAEKIESSAASHVPVLDLAHKILPPNRRIYIVLDGLDALAYDERAKIIKSLQRLRYQHTILLCLSLRLELGKEVVPKESLQPSWTIWMPEEHNPDIRAFVRSELESSLEESKLILNDPTLILEIQDTLERKANGMFLWVALQIQALCIKKTDDAIREALNRLPRTLPEAFESILASSRVHDDTYQRAILEFLVAARRPLTIEELREALSVIPGDTDFKPGSIINDIFGTLTCCGPLLIVDEEEMTVRLIHHSVRQFMLEQFEYPKGQRLTMRTADTLMSQTIVTYLSYGIFDSQVSRNIIPRLQAGTAPEIIIRSTLDPSGGTVKGFALQLLRRSKCNDYDMSKTLAEARRAYQSHQVVRGHQFYNYAKEFCLSHVGGSQSMPISIERLLANLLQRKAFDELHKMLDVGSVIEWALYERMDVVLLCLLEEPAVFDYLRSEKSQNVLEWAARHSHKHVLQRLSSDHHLPPRFLAPQSHLFWAMKHGCPDFTDLVIQTIKQQEPHVLTKTESGQTPLELAAELGNKQAAMSLLNAVTDYDSSSLMAAFQVALIRKDPEMAELILCSPWYEYLISSQSGLDWHMWAVKLAIRYCHRNIISQLLELKVPTYEALGSLLEPATEYGDLWIVKSILARMIECTSPRPPSLLASTALHIAVKRNHVAVLESMVASGRLYCNSRDELGNSPLDLALEQGATAMAGILLEHQDAYPAAAVATKLAQAIISNNMTILETLLQTGKIDLNRQDDNGRTALILAVIKGRTHMVRRLLNSDNHDLDANIQDRGGCTALIHAVLHPQTDISIETIALLVASDKVDIGNRDGCGAIVFSYAIRNSSTKVITLLLNRLKTDSAAHSGELWLLAFDIAIRIRDEGIVSLVLEACPASASTKGHAADRARQIWREHGIGNLEYKKDIEKSLVEWDREHGNRVVERGQVTM